MAKGSQLFLCCLVGFTTASLPTVFDDYFDEEVKIVDVSQEAAIKACVKPSDVLLGKIDRATSSCLGDDDKFDWEDFTSLNTGPDSDQNGLTVKLENAEACFYGEMGWVVKELVKESVILSQFRNLTSSVKSDFVADIRNCNGWDGEMSGSRKRRSVDDSEEVADDDIEQEIVGGELLGWVKSLVRSRRAVVRKPPVKKQPVKKQPVVKKPPVAKKQVPGQGQRIIQGRSGQKQKVLPKKKLPLKKKVLLPKKKLPLKRKVPAPTRDISRTTYNKLWCFDLAVAKALKNCVEDKISN